MDLIAILRRGGFAAFFIISLLIVPRAGGNKSYSQREEAVTNEMTAHTAFDIEMYSMLRASTLHVSLSCPFMRAFVDNDESARILLILDSADFRDLCARALIETRRVSAEFPLNVDAFFGDVYQQDNPDDASFLVKQIRHRFLAHSELFY